MTTNTPRQIATQTFEQDQDQYLQELKDLVKIPSCSFPGFDPKHIDTSAEAVAQLMRNHGFENVEIWTIDGAFPAVFGEVITDPNAPTLLLYNHHDVQPPGEPEQWESPAYEPTERKGRIYGRGVADDKGGISVHISAVASWLKSGQKLPCNIKLFIEGEEEVGSHHLGQFVDTYKERLAADALVITDTVNFDTGVPSLTTALRGMVAVDVEVKALKASVHSGMWGGPVPDAAMALAKTLSALSTDDGRINIDGIYDHVLKLPETEQAKLDALPCDRDLYRSQAGMLEGVQLLQSEKSPFELNWWQPSLSINAMQASSKKDARNILTESAWARVGIRIVPNQDPKRVERLLTEAIKKAAPWGVQVEVHTEAAAAAWMTDTDHPAFSAAHQALLEGYGKEAVNMGCGGSIPFVQTMSDGLGGIPALLFGIEDPYTSAHGPNESLDKGDWAKATKSMIAFFAHFAELQSKK